MKRITLALAIVVVAAGAGYVGGFAGRPQAPSEGASPSLPMAPSSLPSVSETPPTTTVTEARAPQPNIVTVTIQSLHHYDRVEVHNLSPIDQDVYCLIAGRTTRTGYNTTLNWEQAIGANASSPIDGAVDGDQGSVAPSLGGAFWDLGGVACYYDNSGLTWSRGARSYHITNHTDVTLFVTCLGTGDGWPIEAFQGFVDQHGTHALESDPATEGPVIDGCYHEAAPETLP